MKTTLLRAGALSCALLASTALVTPAQAQVARQDRFVDANGVDLTHGDFIPAVPEGSIGSGQARLTLVRDGVWNTTSVTNGHQWDRITYNEAVGGGGRTVTVQIGNRLETFSNAGGTSATGSSLTGSNNNYVYRSASGTTIHFTDEGRGGYGPDSNLCTGDPGQGNCTLVPSSISEPDGKTVDLNWEMWTYCWGEVDGENMPCHFLPRLAGVENSFGYSIQFTYSNNSYPGGNPPPSSWYQRTGATFHNNAVSGNPAQGSVSYSYPSAGVTSVTDMGGNVWRFTGDHLGISAIRRPGAGSDTTTITGTPLAVTSVTRDGVTTNYSRSVSGSTATMTVTDAASQVTTIVSNTTTGRPNSVTDPLSRTTSYTYDGDRRLTRITAPEGNYVNYTYDGRGNVTETRAVAKSGSGLSDIVTTASYDSSCSNPVTCNRPNSTTDARGFRTDYTYDSTHGGILTMTAPAPSGSTPVGSGTRPQTRYSYTLTNGEYRLTGISTCASGDATSGCIGTANEATTAIAYDAQGNVTSVTRDNGAAGLTSTTAMTYDNLGDLLTVDGPLSGSADTTRYRYNAGRQLVGVVGPDPDDGSSLKHRAVRATYTDGLPTRVEQGTVDSQSDGHWAAFAPLQRVEQDYDANARPIVQRLMSGSTTYQLTQTSYDSLGRVRCVAQRMNPSEFGSLPSDNCTVDTPGSYGVDRIMRRSYDNAGQLTKVETGVDVSGVTADEVTLTYTDNGLPQTVTDANGNRTYLNYDGFDRQNYRVMPHPSTTGSWNWGDYDFFYYDAAGNVTQTQRRDGTLIDYSYDNLNRLVTKDLPGSEPTVTYGYDLLGRQTSAAFSGHTLTFGFDALGRNTSQAGPHGTIGYGYDAAGRRTSMTYADSGLVVGYGYNAASDLTEIRENPSGSNTLLATYAWDDRGRRVSITRGNGTVTSYGYDDVSRLNRIVQNLNGSGSDLTLDFTHNPAGEIATNTRSNTAYSYTAHANANVSNSVNGLNQVTATGGTSVYHDSRGNVTGVGSAVNAYSSENMLTSVWGVGSLAYDPLNRLAQTSGGTTTRFGYDGDQMVAEYDSSNALQRRYVFGPGIDEPLLWYEGSGTSTRRYFHADERGSVVAASDASGDVVTAVNRYDEYGNVQGTLTGRFGYTGQAWLPDFGMSYYRARIYNPALGRFMQTDPIGYAGGMNLYAYVGNNPVNFTDPLGLQDEDQEITVTGIPLFRPGGLVGSSLMSRFLLDTIMEQGPGGQEVVVIGNRCRLDSGPVNLNGYVIMAPAAPAHVGGTFTNPVTGQEGTIAALGFGGGLAAGSYSINATFNDVSSLLGGFEFSFGFAFGYGGSITIYDLDGNVIGTGSLSPQVAAPFGAGGVSMDGAIVRSVYGRRCP